MKKRLIIVGAGLSGLVAAIQCERAGHEVVLIDKHTQVGGRVQTDVIDGFHCDRGFQVLLPAYSLAKRYLNYHDLKLQRYAMGAAIWRGDCIDDLISIIVRTPYLWTDAIRFARLATSAGFRSPDALLQDAESPTHTFLHQQGFSKTFCELFITPFFQGIFLDYDLETSSRLFMYYLHFFARGGAAIPAHGMGDIPKQLAMQLSRTRVLLGQAVTSIKETHVTLDDGQTLEADTVIVATSASEHAQLFAQTHARSQRVVTTYLETPYAPAHRKIILNGTAKGPVTHVQFPSTISSKLAPATRSFCCASSVLRPDQDTPSVDGTCTHVARWFGYQRDDLRVITSYTVADALPYQPHITPSQRQQDGIIIAGDWTQTGSIQGAMLSGELAAAAAVSSI